MKIVQNETGKKGKQQQVGEKRKAKTLKSKILQNVGQNDVAAPHSSSSSLHSTVMIDELKSNNSKKNASSNSNSDENGGLNSKQIDSLNITNSDGNHNNNSSELIIAEAAKILLKNGLNGSNAAAAAAVATATATLLTAAANFQLPKPPSPLQSRSSAVQTANATTAAAAHAQLVAIAAAAAAVNATTKHNRLGTSITPGHQSGSSTTPSSSNLTLNNGLLDSSIATNSIHTSSSASAKHQFAKPIETLVTTSMYSLDMGVIDYTINSSPANATVTAVISSVETPASSSIANLSSVNLNSISAQQHHKYSIHSSHNKNNNNNSANQQSRCDIGRLPISNTQSTSGAVNAASNSISYHHNNAHNVTIPSNQIYGGRLQFFKDGKFILELARSKDGDKSGWVSVPREDNTIPSPARSSTIIPSASITGATQSLLAASPAALTGGVGFPKNECSNSLSFSDDNSSIQSSPWQRDHCWKQVTPRKNASKEMSLFYQRPAFQQLTAQALCRARKKRRKPYDPIVTMKVPIFAETTKVDEVIEKDLNDKNSIEKESNGHREDDNRQLVDDDVQNDLTKSKPDNGIGASESEIDVKKEKILDVVETKNNDNSLSHDQNNDVEMTQVSNLSENGKVTAEGMNASDCDGRQKDEKKLTLNGNDEVVNKESNKMKDENEEGKLADSKKNDSNNIAMLTCQRLKKLKYKSRAKLMTIVQKLTDASASRLASNVLLMSKSSITLPSIMSTTGSSSISNVQQSLGHKVSPPSSSATSRLVEHHQQHVSPRKRILREFEKVSLEDNVAVAGGKRSRAKNNNSLNSGPVHSFTQTTINSTSSLHNTKSVVTTSGHIENTHTSNSVTSATLTAVNSNKITIGTPTAPTKLYSSYSIHSLLGGGSDSSSIKKNDAPTPNTINTMVYHQTSAHIQNTSTALPKSPETNCGGKSPSNILSKTKRSPPYAPSMHDAHSRSPSVSGGYTEYGRRSPWNSPDVAHNNFHKVRYTGTSSEHSSSSTQHNNPHHHSQQHQQQHYLHHNPLVAHQQTYYSPYMMSPHYVPAPPTISPTNSASTVTNSHNNLVATLATTINVGVITNSRSPHHHSSAFRAATPTSSSATTTITTASTMHIPAQKELSPTRSMTTSPRDTAPRTVPKKTASIRRQFASPTAAIGGSSTNCSSPNADNRNNSHDETNSNNDRRTPVTAIQQQHLMQRNSPSATSNVAASVLHSYPYIYPPPTPTGGSPHNPPTTSTLMPSTPPGTSPYIPAVVGSPYYHPYISTLAAMRHPQMWMQHYQNTAAVPAAPSLLPPRHPAVLSTSRLSPPYHGFQYNGVGNAAALAAAVAAAAGFGSGGGHQSTIPQSTLSQCSMFAHLGNANMDGNSLAAITNTHSSLSAGLRIASVMPTTPMTDNTTTDLSKSSKDNSHSLASISSSASISTSSSTTIYPINSSKDEQSSDVPLNLSKH
ncbi:protein hairless [Glossina fuscipes]|uniref:Protein hairless n=1 Tax=Glossina fuscipes TaxID=7396 RepID=A0A9C5Z4G5_9MUSC|nr:protein hairless [Glossina fuscipes]XP_037891802.1 protein hairless [Glossina fuscipes]XP_037891803.1 protein hairless [Glossina fuscipes]XP_037891804.1 protein hairless [Glossina fuscipes]XP_037891805.1 protein hairless [Glossina fuscipes]